MSPADAISVMLRPRSVAIVGASPNETSLPGRALDALLGWGFDGAIYLVNPKYDELRGLRCYPSIGTVGRPVDLAIVMVSAALTEDVLRECAVAGVRACVVFASGFSETGEAGQDMQERLAQLTRVSGMRILGPNCQGYFSQSADLVATFSPSLRTRPRDPVGIAYVGQSGAVGGSLAGMADDRGINFRAWFTTGNQADLTATEIATALTREDDISVLLLHLEALPDGESWQRLLASAAEHDTEIVVLRSGTTAAGRLATASHTGSIVGDDLGFRMLSEKYGVHLVEDTDELIETGNALLAQRRLTGDGVAVVTSSGGGGALAADWLTRSGLRVPALSAKTQEELRTLVPAFGEVRNPVDVTAQLFAVAPDAFAQVCARTLADDTISALVVLLTNVIGDAAREVATQLVDAARQSEKPVLVVWVAGRKLTVPGREVLRRERLPLFESVGPAVRVLRQLPCRAAPDGDEQLSWTPDTDVKSAFEALAAGARNDTADSVTEAAAQPLLDAAGLSRPAGRLAHNAAEAAAIAAEVAPATADRVVLKVQSRQISHKTEVGGVNVGVPVAEVRAAFDRMMTRVHQQCPDAVIDGILVQEMAAGRAELLVGITRARLGYPPVVTAGLGGVATEIYADVASGICPISDAGARDLLLSLKAAPLLTGFRGAPPLDVDAAARAISRVSAIAAAYGDAIDEFEINPLIVGEEGAVAADVLLQVRSSRPGTSHLQPPEVHS